MTTHGDADIPRATTYHTYIHVYHTVLQTDESRRDSIWYTYIIRPLGNLVQNTTWTPFLFG